MDKDIIKQIQSYKINSEEKNCKQIISLGKEQMLKNQMKRHSYFDLLLTTIRFIRINTWIMQFVALIISIFIVNNISNYGILEDIMIYLTTVLVFSILFFVDELFKSFTTGMWELEQTFKYDLRQLTMMKLLIFGLMDMLLIIFISVITMQATSIPLLNILLYLLVPYNVICIILFSLVTVWRNNMDSFILWIGVGAMCFVIMIITTLLDIYSLKIIFWVVSYIVTTIILGYIIYTQAKTIKMEVI